MRAVRTLAALAAVLAVVVLGVPAAQGQPDTPAVEVAWWTSAQIAGTPVGAASFVPDGGLQVATSSGRAVSIAAARFTVPDGSDATLVLHLATGSTPELASVVACPTTSAWTAVRAAPLASAPTWDCTGPTASASYDPVAKTLQWSFGADLVRASVVDVMLLPTQGSLPFNVTMAKPGDDATRFTSRPAGAEGGPTTTAAAGGAEAPTPAAGAPSGAAPRPTVSPRPPVAPPATTPPTVRAADGLPSALPAAPVVATTSAKAGLDHRWVGIVLLAVVLAAIVVIARRPAVADGEHAARGVGRFRSARSDPPVSI